MAKRITNVEFARRVGCDHTTASRYRSGERVPSTAMLFRIINAFSNELTDAQRRDLDVKMGKAQSLEGRRRVIGAWLRENIFSTPRG